MRAILVLVALAVVGGAVAFTVGWLEGPVHARVLVVPAGAPAAEPAATAGTLVDAPSARSQGPAARGLSSASRADRQQPAPRYAVELGPFASTTDAERVERALADAGRPTVRFVPQPGAAVYTVLIEDLADERQARALITDLREHGLPEATLVGARPPFAVRAGDAQPLRGAVQVGERLQAQGHRVRLVTRASDAEACVIRHGSFASRDEAEAQAVALSRQGMAGHVVRVR